MFWLIAFLCAVCGAIFSFALPTHGVWWLTVALVPLFVLVARSDRARDAFGFGFWFALPAFALHLLWLPYSFAELFGPAFWVTFPPMLIILGVMWGLVTFLSRFLGGRGVMTLLILPAAWVLMEWGRTQGVFAFPWGTVGYVWLDTPLAQLAELVGVYGLSFVTLLSMALIAVPFVQIGERSRTSSAVVALPVLIGLGLLAAASVYGMVRTRQLMPTPTESALLVQGNIDPLARAQGVSSDLEIYARLTSSALADISQISAEEAEEESARADAAQQAPAEANVSLVIWPEGAILQGNISDEVGGQPIRDVIAASAGDAGVITGGARRDPSHSYNTVYSLARGDMIAYYDKVYLVPFGEYFPFVNSSVLRPIYRSVFSLFGLPLLSSRSPGEDIIPIDTPVGLAGAYVCYESVFPHVARDMVDKGAKVLVNISNDAWFGQGQGAQQHFDMGRMRAIETRRYLLRVGNDGITGVVDPLGRTQAQLPRGQADTLTVPYSLSDTLTPYVRYGGSVMVILLVYLALIATLSLFTRPNA